ncbi:hypothetical protein NP493_470g01002 [Ridgeia piscesae]|uniref:Uncharacterized protein n=1 Tax=Ridgeia piscesae TaxID=27915 RepID=A0AAD9NUG2_RIDPI|nr:hypothetical protein NP493_470g01002 [Ridgeia piscesae]
MCRCRWLRAVSRDVMRMIVALSMFLMSGSLSLLRWVRLSRKPSTSACSACVSSTSSSCLSPRSSLMRRSPMSASVPSIQALSRSNSSSYVCHRPNSSRNVFTRSSACCLHCCHLSCTSLTVLGSVLLTSGSHSLVKLSTVLTSWSRYFHESLNSDCNF